MTVPNPTGVPTSTDPEAKVAAGHAGFDIEANYFATLYRLLKKRSEIKMKVALHLL